MKQTKKNKEDDSFRIKSDEEIEEKIDTEYSNFIDMSGKNPFAKVEAMSKARMSYRPENCNREVGSGAFIMVTEDVPTEFNPEKWSIYWAVPFSGSGENRLGYDRWGRYLVDIIIPFGGRFEKVSLHPHEYIIVKEENLNLYIQEGWHRLKITGYEILEDNKLTDTYINYTEEERNVIDAFRLDGLTLEESVQEYLNGRHVNKRNQNVMYKVTEEGFKILENLFGKR